MQIYFVVNKTENVREWCEVISLNTVPNFNVRCSTHSWFTPDFLYCINSFISFVCRMRFTTEVTVETRKLCNNVERIPNVIMGLGDVSVSWYIFAPTTETSGKITTELEHEDGLGENSRQCR